MERSIMSPSDIMATYEGTWIEVRPKDCDSFIPVRVSDTYEDFDGNPGIICYDVDGGRRRFPLYRNPEDVRWSWPELGMVNIRDFAVYHARRANRQWRRGVRRNQVNSHIHGSDMGFAAVGDSFGGFEFDNSENISQMFNPTYTPLNKAIELVSSGKCFARAVNKHFAITSDPSIEVPVLAYKQSLVGVVQQDGVIRLYGEVNHLEPAVERLIGGS